MATSDEAKSAAAEASSPPCRVVAIGSSAGGLAALQALFNLLPADLGVAFVVVTHLDPDHSSELAPILSHHTRMPVVEVMDTLPIEANHVYVIAPDRQLAVADDEIASLPFEEPRGRRTPIDRFFGSLAERQCNSFAIVLSGSGSDGTNGVRAMKGAGGVVLVQEPKEAAYPSMPQSAIDTGCVDVVAPMAQLAAKLVDLVGHGQHPGTQETAAEAGDAVNRILTYLRTRTGHDFSSYKTPTILRRLTRRMQLRNLERMDDYFAYLRNNVEEVQSLFGDFLISVTTFFRDPEAFDALGAQAIPRLVSRSSDDTPLRVWVPGCATGEEVYSLAMLLLEEATRQEVHREIQIFATDIDAAALETARDGLYPETIESDVTEERLQRFFTREGERYRIKRAVRDLVIFANHSLLKDPPFSRLDLVSCRNLLIYLEPDAQKRVLATVHYALNPGGFLFLGSAESAEGVPAAFRVVDRKNRIYQAIRQAEHPPLPPRIPVLPAITLSRSRPLPLSPASAGEASAHRKALEEFAPPSVLVDADQRVLHLSETAGRFLQHPGGTPTSNIVQLIRPELKFELSRGLQLAFERGETSLSLPVPVQFNGTQRRVILHVQPVKRDDAVGEALVVFLDGGPVELVDHAITSQPGREEADAVVGRLHEELEFSQELLRVSRAEYETTNEELRAANEELQSINEEYRSTSEELETSREELQSMNEELQTLNSELRSKVESLSLANANLQNLIAATEGGTLFIDTELRIKLFTPGIVNQFNITASDTGRPITDFTHRLKYDGLVADARSVLRDLVPVQREIESTGGDWFLMRVRPYRTLDGRIDGVVITFIDLTQLHRTEAALKESEARFRALVTANSYVVYRMSPDWKEMRALDGHGFISDTKQPSTDWLDTYIDPADQPLMKEAIAKAMRTRSTFELEHRVKRPDGKLGWALSRAIPLLDGNGGIVEWFGAISDVTERHRVQEDLAQVRRIETVGRLAGGIAHDFNNLLTVITANLELVEQSVGDESARQLIDQAVKAAELGASFNRRLLSLAGKHRYEPQRVDVNERVSDTAALLKRVLGEQIAISTRLTSDLWPVDIDPAETDSALLNLALNARDAMPGGGEIVFATRNVTVDAASAAGLPDAKPGDYLCLSVADTGVGMTQETLSHATEAFFSTKENNLGTGLGLFSVQTFVRQAGGFLDLASKPGTGTTVSLYLPRAGARVVDGAGAGGAGSVPRGDGERVLVVEDEENVREVAKRLLETLGYAVVAARTADDAIALLEPGAGIDLVFSDIVMPGKMSGTDLARWIHAQRPGIKVLLTSGYSAEAADGDLGGVKVLSKPYTRAELGQAVHAALGSA